MPWPWVRQGMFISTTTVPAGTGVVHLQLPLPCNPRSGRAGFRTLTAEGGNPASALDEVTGQPPPLVIWPPALTATGPWGRQQEFLHMQAGTTQ